MADCIFSDGTTPNQANGLWTIEQKILCALNAIEAQGGGGGGGTGGTAYGSGSPYGVVTPAADGELYWDTSTSPNEQWQARGTTNTSWVQVT